MQIKLVFENSGDELVFTSINSEVAEYYIDSLNQSNNNNLAIQTLNDRVGNNTVSQISRNIGFFRQAIDDANSYIHLLTGNKLYELYSDDELLDQNLLNKLHSEWVDIHNSVFNIQQHRSSYNSEVRDVAERLFHLCSYDSDTIQVGEALSKLGLSARFDQVNQSIHNIEESFNYLQFRTKDWHSVHNPFPASILTNDVCNLRIAFNHLGRTLYNKYINFDNNFEYNDENSFSQLLGFVGIYLCRPQTIPLSTEYIAWCQEKNIIPSGNFLNLGNLPNIDTHLTEYRKLMYRNTKNNNQIKLIKG